MRLSLSLTALDEDGMETALEAEQTNVNIQILDAKSQVLRTYTPAVATDGNAINRINTLLDTQGAQALTLTASYPGYTQFSRRLELSPSLSLSAVFQAVPTQAVSSSSMVSVSGRTLNGFNVAMGGDNATAPELKINIPESLLPGVTGLQVAAQTFDPNDPEDATYFPGDYADSDGNNLVSVAFNYIEVTTDTGVSLADALAANKPAAGRVSAFAAPEPITVNRAIPESSCPTLKALGDSAADVMGFQIPVYTYNTTTGVWDLLGQGTVYDTMGNKVSAIGTELDCSNPNYELEIVVSNQIFLSNWWNLDYPLYFSQPRSYYATVQVQNDEGEDLSGLWGTISSSNPTRDFATINFVTDANGRVQIEVSSSSTEATIEATLYLYGGSNQSSRATITLSETRPTTPKVVALTSPKMCGVAGEITYKDTIPSATDLVFAFADDVFLDAGGDATYTDDKGNFVLNAICNEPYTLSSFSMALWGQERKDGIPFNVNGIVEEHEETDDGKTVILKKIPIKPFAPTMIIARTEGQTVQLAVLAAKQSAPFNYSIVFRDINGNTLNGQPTVGTITQELFDSIYSSASVNFTLNNYTFDPKKSVYATVTITDSFGETYVYENELVKGGEDIFTGGGSSSSSSSSSTSSSSSSTSSGSPATGKGTVTVAQLQGTWVQDCVADDIDNELTEYGRVSITFSGNTATTQFRSYTDAECTKRSDGFSEGSIVSSYVLGDDVVTEDGTTATAIDTVTAIPFLNVVDQRGYDIIYINGDQLYYGLETDFLDGETPQTRYNKLDNQFFTKQK